MPKLDNCATTLFGQSPEGKLIYEMFFKSGALGQIHLHGGRFVATIGAKDKTKTLIKTFASEREAKSWIVENESEVNS